MTASVQATELKVALQSQEALTLRGFNATCGTSASVVVDRWGHMRGVWHFYNGNFFWTDGASSQPSFRTNSIEGAVAHTLSVVAAK
ncbi:MAG TPA: hypothetical protein PLD46_02740 [Hyphomicrobium sp.]|nr:hypothetical protein [Hyphomicrobium sp.]